MNDAETLLNLFLDAPPDLDLVAASQRARVWLMESARFFGSSDVRQSREWTIYMMVELWREGHSRGHSSGWERALYGVGVAIHLVRGAGLDVARMATARDAS